MLSAGLPPDEPRRLQALRNTDLLDSPAEERFDRLTRLAQQMFGVPVALVSLVDEGRQWFKSRQGLDACETGREVSFCAHAILGGDLFEVPDACCDARFADNPLVTGPPHVRFYAGAVLRSPEGLGLGTLCIIDHRPRALDAAQRQALRDLGDCVQDEVNRINQLRQAQALEQAQRQSLASQLALQQERDFNAALFGAAGAVMVVLDRDGRIVRFNPAAEQITGHRAEDVVGQPVWSVFLEPRERAAVMAVFDNLKAGRIVSRHENHWLMRDGSLRLFDWSNAVLPDGNGDVAFIVSIGVDITERRRMERMKDEFISTVSHELRTPLTAIRGALGLLGGGVLGALNEPAAAMLKIAGNNTERLLLLINDILDIQKIESGEMALRFRRLEATPLVRRAMEDLAAYGASRGVRFELTGQADGAFVHADRNRLIQVLANLLSNAAKFSPSDSTVVVHLSCTDDRHLRIAVTDRGPGIPLDFQPRVFERFTQADASDSRGKGGTGLGLAIAKAIVLRHGGTIGFQSTPGQGATFHVDLPLLPGPTASQAPHMETAPA